MVGNSATGGKEEGIVRTAVEGGGGGGGTIGTGAGPGMQMPCTSPPPPWALLPAECRWVRGGVTLICQKPYMYGVPCLRAVRRST